MIALIPAGTGRLWLMLAGVLLVLGLIGGSLYLAYDQGRTVKNAEWQSRWNARDAGDQQAWALAQVGEREKEQARQHSINKAIQDGQQLIDQALADAAAARATAGSLRDTADDLARRLASQTGSHSCTAAASSAASRAVLVLADVLKRADERAGDLAEYADQGRSRGLTCEQAYGALD
ncbi:DUF2514 family protein [Pseudomonas sp. Leaf127]|uniref:DUF2514 family protein n=1 Tax=Pseudomonas sp. Leaf127 TaxID=1736267 RepID=UPI002E7FFE0F|nr:DUF2514 family protein [Pseudomonas sp. Leaf127]